MPVRIALCDDNPEDRRLIQSTLADWGLARGVQFTTDEYDSAEAYLFAHAEPGSHDLVLLDIEMGGMDGVTLARRLRMDDDNVQLVFITGYSDYIAEGYEVSALHYLMKPLKTDKFFSVLDRAYARIRKNERTLTLETADETVRVTLPEIRWLEVSHNYVTVHARRPYTVKKTLRELEEALDERFYRVGRSTIVNLSYIARVTKTEVHLTDGSVVPLPRGAYDAVNRAIIAQN